MKSNEFVQKEVDTRMQKDEKKEKKGKKDMLVIFWEDERTWLGALHEGRKKGTAIYKARYHIEIRPAYDELKKSTTQR